MRVLVLHSHTLYLRASLPLALRLLSEGHEVDFQRAAPRLTGFSQRYVRENPTGVAAIDRRALRYVAQVSGLAEPWRATGRRAGLTARPRYDAYDVVVGTTKDLTQLRATGRPSVALGYQHFPVALTTGPTEARVQSLFLKPNPFTAEHGFVDLATGWHAAPTGFTYVDRIVQEPASAGPTDEVLVFHPGGRRGVDSDAGDPDDVAARKQRAVLERACLPALAAGLRPVIKVHPLRAAGHDTPDVERIARAIERDHGYVSGSVGVLGPAAWHWPVALRAALVVSYGSSALYELWSAGVERAVVCNFEGRARSERFSLFESVFIETHDQYAHLLSEGAWGDVRPTGFAADVAAAYAELGDGQATARAVDLVEDTVARAGRLGRSGHG